MSALPTPVPALVPAAVNPAAPAPALPPSWRLSTFCGRLGEISGRHAPAALTLVFRLVLEAQRRGEPVAWIALSGSAFYPPDAAEAGIDLAALAVVWADTPHRSCRAADWLVRSGAFGLVVMDLGERACLPIPVQSRLVGLAGKHDTALVCLTEKDDSRPSIGSLVAVRAEATRRERIGDRYRCEARVLKDKRRGPGWKHAEICRGPDGLR
jgi:recombination protein RecA